jgi:hypothetical protein
MAGVTCAEMLRKLEAIDLQEEVGEIIDQNLEELKQLNLAQLMQGKNNQGQLLSPLHSDNPFFKTPEAGLRYAAWKKRLWPETPFNVANLKITGVLHDSLSFSRRGDTVSAQASAPFAPSVEQTFNGTPFGLDDESKKELWVLTIKRPLVMRLAIKIGCDVV